MTVDDNDRMTKNSHNVINERNELGLDLDSADGNVSISQEKKEHLFANNISNLTKSADFMMTSPVGIGELRYPL
jgi:hypothetical protein